MVKLSLSLEGFSLLQLDKYIGGRQAKKEGGRTDV